MSDEEGGSSGGHGGPVWLLTYCDLITLLVAFFVMMISFSSINVNKCKEDMPKIEEGFYRWWRAFVGRRYEPCGKLFEKDLNVLERPVESLVEPDDMYNYLSGFVEESGLKSQLTSKM